MNSSLRHRTLSRFLLVALCFQFAVLASQHAYGQDSQPADVLRHLRKHDPQAALKTLGALVDKSISIGDLAYSGLPSAAGGFYRSLSQQSADEQYELLEKWTLPDGDRNGIRMLTVPVPTDAPPKVFSRSLGERSRDSTFTVASVGPVRGFYCSGWMLVNAAEDLGLLARLRLTLDELATSGVVEAQELLMLAHLAGSRGELDRVEAYLHTCIEGEEENSVELTPLDMTKAAIASAATLHQELQPLGEAFLAKLVDRSGNGKSIGLRSFLRIAHATAVQVHLGESPPDVLFENSLRHWIPATVRTARDIDRGQPSAVWLAHEQHVLHLAGAATDVLLCRFPMVGEFDFVCETQEGGSIGTDGGLVYGGLQFQALGRKDTLTVWDADTSHELTKPSPFARFETDPVFNRVSIRSDKEGANFESNFHPVWFDDSSSQSSPWFGLRSSGTKRPVFRNFRVTGKPVIPREVRLTSGDQLRGWQSGFFDETQPGFHGRADQTESNNQSYDWRIDSGEVISAKQADAAQAAKPGWLRYQRPLLKDESITYEFWHQGDKSIVHPSVGRLAFLLESTGIRVRWITTGELEWTGLEPDNAALEPLNRRGPRPLPLRENEWNSVSVELSGDNILVTLNDELVYQRPIDNTDETQFGLYRASRTVEARVREAVMTGDWPETLPEGFVKDPVALIAASMLPRDHHARGPLVGDDLVADNVIEIRRLVAQLPVEQRFEFLSRWVLPNETHSDFRMAGSYLPTSMPPPVCEDGAWRASSEAAEAEPKANESQLVSPVFDLLDVAATTGMLPQLRQRIAALSPRGLPNQQAQAALLALVDLEQGNPTSAAKSITFLHDSIRSSNAKVPSRVWPAMLVAHRGIYRFPASQPVADLLSYLNVALVVPNNSILPTNWRSQIRSLAAKLWKVEWASSTSGIDEASELEHWFPVSQATAALRGTGHAAQQWEINKQGAISHLCGASIDYLAYQSPLRGNYCVEADLSSDQLGQVLNAGHFIGPDHSLGQFQRGDLGMPAYATRLAEPLGKFDRWVHYRAEVSDASEQVFLNGRLMLTRNLSTDSNPWLALRSWYKNGAQFRELRIGGSPIIPNQVSLSQSLDLAGWGAYYSGPILTNNPFWQSAPEEQGGVVITGLSRGDLKGSHCERLLRYFRPLIEGGSVEFDFFYDPDTGVASPTLDRLVFLLTPDGVAEHWITDGEFDRTLLRPDNVEHVKANQRHGGTMPLLQGRWNRVRMELADNSVRLLLNNHFVYERELEAANDRTFGLFHFADQGALRSRRVIMHGNWPTELPAPQSLADPIPDQLDARLPQLTAVFSHDFRQTDQTTRYFNVKTLRADPNAAETADGLRLSANSNGNWNQIVASPEFSLQGDFDVTASFSGVQLPTDSELARVAMMISLNDEYQRRLVAAMGTAINQGLHVMGSINLSYPDGTQRYLKAQRADESTSGRLRIARRGDQIYFLVAQGDSDIWRTIHQESASTADISTGGIQLACIAKGTGTTIATWEKLTLHTEKLMVASATEPIQTLSVFRVDGTAIHDLTTPTANMLTLGSPEWSPDGSRITYDQSSGGTGSSRVMIIDKFGHQPTDIGYGSMPTFSPNGTQIAFSAAGEGVGIMNVDGTNRQILDRRGWGIQWSPATDYLAYSIGGDLYLWDLKKSSSKAILQGDAATRYSYIYWNMAWSPDGKHIAIKGRRRDNAVDEIAIMTLSNPSRFQVILPDFKGGSSDLAWSMDSRQIVLALSGNGFGGSQLFTIDCVTGGPPQLLAGQPSDRNIASGELSPDGQWFVIAAKTKPGPVLWTNSDSSATFSDPVR